MKNIWNAVPKAWKIIAIITVVAVLMVGSVAFLYVTSISSVRNQANAIANIRRYENDVNKRIAKICTDKAAMRECIESELKGSHENVRSELELAAQQDASSWTWWSLVLSLAQFVVGGIGLWAIIRTLRQGEENLALAKQAMKLERRPWLIVKNISIDDISIAPDGPRGPNPSSFIAKIDVENVGNSPAKDIAVNYGVFPWGHNFDTPSEIVNEMAIKGIDLIPADGVRTVHLVDIKDPSKLFIRYAVGQFVAVIWIRYRSFVQDEGHEYLATWYAGRENYKGTMQNLDLAAFFSGQSLSVELMPGNTVSMS